MNLSDTVIGWWLDLDSGELTRHDAQVVAVSVSVGAARRLVACDSDMRMQGSRYLSMLACGERLLAVLRTGDRTAIRAARAAADAMWERERPYWRDTGDARADRATAVLGASQVRWLLQPVASRAHASTWCPPQLAAYLQGELARTAAVQWAGFVRHDGKPLWDLAGHEAVWAERQDQRRDAMRALALVRA